MRLNVLVSHCCYGSYGVEIRTGPGLDRGELSCHLPRGRVESGIVLRAGLLGCLLLLEKQSLKEVQEKVQGGYRMEAPEDCPPGVYSIMMTCWEQEPRRRPAFHKLREKLEREMGKHSPNPRSEQRGGDGIRSGSGC